MSALLAAAVAAQVASAQPPMDQHGIAPDSNREPDDTIIITGTRFSGLRAKDSLEPVQVVTSQSLKVAGPPNLSDSLADLVPSLNTQAVGNDLANETLAARLRGVSPNHTLVLVNGKRLHGTANLSVLSSAFQGGAAPDLNFIPVASIKRVEVLLDGAAAQYGSDAIAGVINIILNDSTSGGWGEAYAGEYGKGDGETLGASASAGAPLGPKGFLDLSFETRFHDFSNAGGPDARVEQAIASGAHPDWADLDGYPLLNKVFGDARYTQQTFAANMGYDLGSVQAYAFGTLGYRNAGGWANFRLPTKLPELYPHGFNPIDRLKSWDYSATIGLSGNLAGWAWDLSTTDGRNSNRVEVTDSANVDLFHDTGSTPTNFHNGSFKASEWTTNLDVRRRLSSAVGLALGAEYRHDSYALLAGDEASRYKAGSQSFPGFALTDAGSHGRSNQAAYADLNVLPGGGFTVDLASRFEHYSDFGSTVIGKISARKEISPGLAVRGTASSGFRAPSLAEAYYSATNVQPNTAFVQLPPNAPAAALIGVKPLAPEHARNFSIGAVATPAPRVSFTIDAYQISIRNRVVGSGTLYGTYAGELRSDAVNQAIIANGNVLENVPFTGINVFTNGLDTRTRGVDVVANLRTPLPGRGSIQWSLSGSYSRTKVTRIRETPPQIAASGQSLFDPVAISTLETASPRFKAILSALYATGRWTVSGKERFYGNAYNFEDPGDGKFYRDSTGSAFITDIDVSFALFKSLSVSVGANNLFDKRPNRVNAEALAVAAAAGSPAVEIYPKFSAFGINGGYYYARARVNFR
ncbi:TonB-dependent receptor [Sphingomonas sp.]|uniref:TonB-dependent receptor plug domain-containing protein n=1 Tax=Sphingomonas sp. TaxID=28214 RepID=UPI0025F787FB|nr:TonB-dependent receptor [Sphingomonas sp.]MBV9529461.1 TonB-dependent receptor [Sphingomonas sp.]